MTHPFRSSEELTLTTPYGGFCQDGSYVITDPLTPRPWAQVLANESYGLVLSQSGSGFSWHENCQLARLNRWEQDLVSDCQGRYLYVQSAETGLFSSTYQPTRRKADREAVTYRPGSATFERQFGSLITTQTVFVPLELPMEFWLVKVQNCFSHELVVDLGLYLEFHLGGPGEWHREFQRLFMETRHEGDSLYAWKHPGLIEGSREREKDLPVFFIRAAGQKVSWITDKGAFLGRQGSVSSPAAMEAAPASYTSGRWDDPIAGARWQVSVPAGESVELVLAFGAGSTLCEAQDLAESVSLEMARKELEAVESRWRRLLDATQVHTGNEALDLMANVWLPYQTLAGRMTARCAYYQQGGAYGYRDQLQDSLLCLTIDPERTKLQLVRHAEAMKPDGSVKHWWHPSIKWGVDSHHIDTSVWLAFGVLAYLDETADLPFLQSVHGFWESEERDTMLNHLVRGIDRALSRTSERGLPLIGGGDWNDGLSHVGPDGKGDSVWMAIFLYDVLTRLQPVLHRIGESSLAERFASEASRMERAVEEHGWDGQWRVAGYRDSGEPFGSSSNKEGQIFLNMQTWAVLSGIGPDDRRDVGMASARERLVQDYGALLLQPAYSQVDPTIGYITRYAPGLRENGGVYSHASAWAALAFAKWGDFATAWRIALGMLPPLRAQEDPDLYAAEPYVTPGNVDGPDSPFAGRAGWTWYTGSSAWLKRAILEGLFGVRATFEGLVVEERPLPMEEATFLRSFRGGEVEIHWSTQVSQAQLDGAPYRPGDPISVDPGQRRKVVMPVSLLAAAPSGEAAHSLDYSGVNP